MDALLVVDMQQASLAHGRQHDLPGVCRRIDALADQVRAGAGTVIFVLHDGEPGEGLEPHTPGWEITPALTERAGDLRITKRLNDPFHATGLGERLAAIAPDRVLVTGWATDFCVDAAVRSAVSRGHHVVVPSDCHTLEDRPHLDAARVIEHHNWVWSNLIAPASVRVLPMAEIARS